VCACVFEVSTQWLTIRSWWSQWESCDREVTSIHATVHTCYCWWSLNRCETGTVVHTAFLLFLFLGPSFSVLPFLLWNSLWLVEEVLTLLYFFWIMRIEISQFLWEVLVHCGWQLNHTQDRTQNGKIFLHHLGAVVQVTVNPNASSACGCGSSFTAK
jgi:hypothetical protein